MQLEKRLLNRLSVIYMSKTMEIVMKFIKPNRLHESNIQAEAYRQLRNNNVKCCLEYSIHCPEFNSNIRADIILIKDNKITAIIECKSRKRNKEPNYKGRQYKKYQSLGLPIIYCMDFSDAINIMSKIKDYI